MAALRKIESRDSHPGKPLAYVALGLAAGILLLLAGAHLLGWRDHVSVLSGTVPGEGGTVGQGVAYAGIWFAAVVVAPILVLATGIYAALTWPWRLRPTDEDSLEPSQ